MAEDTEAVVAGAVVTAEAVVVVADAAAVVTAATASFQRILTS
jgi:hypothetical protein